MANRKKGEKVLEQLDEVLTRQIRSNHQRGAPLAKTKFPTEAQAIDAFLKREGGKAYMRLAAWARSRELKQKKPDLFYTIQKFLFDAGYPKKLIEGEISLPVKVSFELVKTPQELESPSLLVEAKVIDEDVNVEEADFTDAVTAD